MEMKLAPTAGIRTALQYCRTLPCSRLSVGFFIGCPSACRSAADRIHPSPAWAARIAPVLSPAPGRTVGAAVEGFLEAQAFFGLAGGVAGLAGFPFGGLI